MAISKRKGSKSDKWTKMSILSRNSTVRHHIPQTKIFGKVALASMLASYGSVYIKPRRGSFGKGIIKVFKSGRGYSSHIGTSVSHHSNLDLLYSFLSRYASSNYIIQRTIRSIKYQGKIVDFRVVVQLNGRGQAHVTGIAGRVARGGRVVSNGGGGGAVGDLESFFRGNQYSIVKHRLEGLALSVMGQVRRSYPRQTEIGVDIAVDEQLNTWIIEHNYTPDHRMFHMIGNGQTLRKIVYYGSLHGKRYRL